MSSIGAAMTNEEIQARLDELEQKRNDMYNCQERRRIEAEAVLASIRNSVSVLQKSVEEEKNATRTRRHITRA